MRKVIARIVNSITRIEAVEAFALFLASLLGRIFANRAHVSTSAPIDIDAVYLWVDNSDEKWIAKKNKFTNASQAADSESRFREFGELQKSLELLARNAPWLRKVFIVSDDQTPNLTALRSLPFEVEIVFHSQFMNQKDLPTFSSRALTANLHRIEGLAEQFLYMNDDTFIAAPSQWSDFFSIDSDGKVRAKLRHTKTPMPALESLAPDEVVYRGRYRAHQLAASKGWKIFEGQPEHGAHPILKSAMAALWHEFPQELAQVSSEKFRTSTGVLSEWLHDQYLMNHDLGQDASGQSSYKYVAMNSATATGGLVQVLLRRGRILVVCLNDEAGQSVSGARLAKRYARVLGAL